MKKLYLAIGISTLILIIIAAALLYVKNIRTPSTVIEPAPSTFPTITPIMNIFRLEKVVPSNNAQKAYFPITKITFTFTQDVRVEDVNYVITPATEVLVLKGQTNKDIVIVPRRDWKEGVADITIQPTTHSMSGVELDRSIEYKIRTAYPSTINPDTAL